MFRGLKLSSFVVGVAVGALMTSSLVAYFKWTTKRQLISDHYIAQALGCSAQMVSYGGCWENKSVDLIPEPGTWFTVKDADYIMVRTKNDCYLCLPMQSS